LRLRVHSERDVHISRQIREEGIWEAFETELLRRSLTVGNRFLDAGANIGYFTVLAAACVGETGKVLAVEPEQRNFDLLQSNIELNGFADRVQVVCAGLSERSGEARLHLHPENLGDHQLHSDAEDRESVTVPLITGADLLADGSLDLVKIDTQGSEHEVVLGLLPVLQRSGPGLRMIVELTPSALRRAGTSGAALVDCLETLALPFSIVDHIEHRLVPISATELHDWCTNLDSYPEDEGFMNIFLGAPV
jgi:FkbM family methyltransferase